MLDTDRFTSADLERISLPDGWRAEIIDGAVFVSRAPSWEHQAVVGRIANLLDACSEPSLGRVNMGVGVIYDDTDDVIPDVVWISTERLARGLDRAGHLRAVGPELVVEVLSPGKANEERDRKAKLSLYTRRDALEYWIVDPKARTVDRYVRREGAGLELVVVCRGDDFLTCSLLGEHSWGSPRFSVRVSGFWPAGLD